MKSSYRPEIDGFRALAVTSVVLFHAKIPGFSNGFAGVDIFFVISGFLITSIIARERSEGRFFYSRFVMRRVRRILPALILVMLSCIPLAWCLMLPDPLENFGQSLLATVLSSNNILLWLTSGYWDLSSDFKPLLHTWSLGVEEQFYILYPLLLVLALRLGYRLCITLLVFTTIMSFTLMVWKLQTDPAAAFYLLPYRAWQLLCGGIAGLLSINALVGKKPVLAGVGLLLVLIALMPTNLPMPVVLGIASLGTALYLLFSESQGAFTWVFTRKPIVFLGVVSYSFYLWHQPIFAFLRLGRLQEPSQAEFLLGSVIAFGLAVLTWHFVEKPFRSPTKTARSVLWGFVGIGMALPAIVGVALHIGNGYPQRLNYPDGVGAAGQSIDYNERVHDILPRSLPKLVSKRPVVLIAGNSFARDLANIIIESELAEDLILLYRDDLTPCAETWGEDEKNILRQLDLLIFASGNYSAECITQFKSASEIVGLPVFWSGPKHFGENLNPLVQLSPKERSTTRLEIPDLTRSLNEKGINRFGERYVDIISALSDDGKTIRVADARGVLLTTDRVHLSRAGAIFLSHYLQDFFPGLYILAGKSNER